MWSLDDEPALRSTFISVSLLDQALDRERFRARIARAVDGLSILRQRVVPTPFDLAPPRWEEDPDFDLDRHLAHRRLRRPGGTRQLLDLAAAVCAEPFDRSHPLWQFTLVDGLRGGGGALLVKMHHVLSDGVGAVRISASFVDLAADGDLVEPAPRVAADGDLVEPAGRVGADVADVAAVAAVGAAAGPGPALRRGGWLGDAAGTVGPIVGANASEFRRNVAALAEGISTVVRAPTTGAAYVVAAARSIAGQVGSADRARSPLWTTHDNRHRFDVTTWDLGRIKAVANGLGGTVNDAFVTILAGAAGAYHRDRGTPVDELRVSVPVSVRHDHEAAGNAWVPTRVLVPTGELAAPERFAAVHTRLRAVKGDPALGMADGIARTVWHLPRPLLVRVARRQIGTVDFACSNVRGAPFDLWIAGSHVEANHPFGPTAGVAFNATILSYRSALDVGINVDTGAVDHPDHLLRCIKRSTAEFLG
jgi:diacylglycerol O-acyltransferase / wax synthase